MYYRDADACLLVYDVADRETFDNLRNVWLAELKQRAPYNITIAIMGNKGDLADEQKKINSYEIDKLIEESGAVIHKEVSA